MQWELMRFVVMKLKRFPSEYLALSVRERAVLDAIIIDSADKEAETYKKIRITNEGGDKDGS